MQTPLDAALIYAALGWAVIPLHNITQGGGCSCGNPQCGKNAGKHPRLKNWPNQASKDASVIQQWFTQWPEANVGIATGSLSNLVVLDVDRNAGGEDSLYDLIQQHGRLPDTVESITGGGGRHIYFLHPGQPIRNSVSTLGQGLDIRADGGQVVAPPSNHQSGKVYEWEATGSPGHVMVAPLPHWLCNLILPTSSPPPGQASSTPPPAQKFQAGKRNATLASLAGSMRRRGFTQAQIEATLLVINQTQCNPPLPDAEVRKIAASIGKYSPPQRTNSNLPTHTEIARHYVTQHREDTLYSTSQWFHYEDGLWKSLHDKAFNLEIWELLEMYELHSGLHPTASIRRSVEDYLQAALHIPDDRLDAHPNLINLQTGTYDLELGALLTHNASHYITTQLPFAYDANATAPTWEYFLQSSLVKKDLTHDPELAMFVQEAVGYSLTADISHHTTFWCLGEGANGKGTLFHILGKLAGTAAIALNVNILRKEQYQLANLVGKRIALCSEANATDNLVEDALIKQLVAGDPLPVRQIRKEPFTLYPKAKLWWAMNKLPAVADTSKGFWRRIKVIPFWRQFNEDERIMDLKEKLEEELPGIFNWAIVGLQRLKLRGMFDTPAQVQQETEDYMKESNTVAMYIDDCCVKDPTALALCSSIYTDYKNWCFENGFKAYSVKSFKREMEALKYWYKHLSHGRFFAGIRLR